MAESVVSFLLERLATFIEQEVELLEGVDEEVRDIQSELQAIRAFLKDADAKSESDAGVKAWVKEVRDVAYKIEAVLDELLLPNHHTEQAAYQDGQSPGSCIGSTKNALRAMVDFFRCTKLEHQMESLKADHKIGTEIKAIKARIERISQRKERYKLSSSEQEGQTSSSVGLSAVRDPREDALFLEESQLVGIDGPRDELLTFLVDADPKLRVVSVYGMGGLGKTTLSKKVYDDERLKHQFPSRRAWITVSQTFDTRDLLRRLIEQLIGQLEGLDKMGATQMKQTLNDKLRRKRYVVVLDDIWTSNAWKGLKNALPDDNCGSRIIITTRFENIAAETCRVGYGLKYPLKPLNVEESRKLFYRKAFKSNVPKQVASDPCSKFLKKCNGLPLGIVAIAGLLSTKQPSEWDQVYQSLGTLMDGSIDRQLDDLRLVISYSFNDLPYHLKACFLFMSIFPEDYAIQCSRLFRLWAAEGFVVVDKRPGMNFTKEELARFYLDELIQRSLVQVEKLNDRTRVKSCKLHDLMREFIIGKANSENFVTFTSDGLENDWSSSGQPLRRLSVGSEVSYESDKSAFSLRSLFLFHVFPAIFEGFPRFKLLKVLDVEDSSPNSLRHDEWLCKIGVLSNLRYLRLRNCELDDIGTLFGKLVHIETLDLKGSFMHGDVFREVLEMRQLRNLIIGSNSDMVGLVLPVGIHKLTLLEKLGVVDLGVRSDLLISEFGKMTLLRKLAVYNLQPEDVVPFFLCVTNMKFLRTLKVTLHGHEFLHSGILSSPPPSLQSLYMAGTLNPLPPWISSLLNLEKLVLCGSHLKDDPMEQLQLLPSLVTLILYHAYDGEKMYIAKGGFPSLKKLYLLELANLNEVKVERGAMRALESITHGGCDRLHKFPEGGRGVQPEIIHAEYPIVFVKQSLSL